MARDVVMGVDGIEQVFHADDINTSGGVRWIPEEDSVISTATIRENGQYEAQFMSCYGLESVLVLVDGMRWVNESSASGVGAATDLNTIPLAIVERIEVLADGASSLYGSDAIAGVVNIITRRKFDGGQVTLNYGQFDKGDGASKGVDLATEMLEIALCAQHNNGGLAIDEWWQSTIPGLFVCGEAAGSHGVYRPGGSAIVPPLSEQPSERTRVYSNDLATLGAAVATGVQEIAFDLDASSDWESVLRPIMAKLACHAIMNIRLKGDWTPEARSRLEEIIFAYDAVEYVYY
jgi:hypothetical protein